MTATSTIQSTEPATDGESAGARRRPPVRELVPRGTKGALVLAAGVLLAAESLTHYGLGGQALVGVVLLPVLVLLGAIDLEHRLLPNPIVLPTALVVAVIVAASQPRHFLLHLAAGVMLGGLFFASAALIPGSIGMGDAKLALLVGLALGSKTLPAVEIAFLAVLAAALWMIGRQGLGARKKTIPFGPFLALGGIIGFFLG
jgi:leader peptidase (prepilin peptidase) / N-methyltransferase